MKTQVFTITLSQGECVFETTKVCNISHKENMLSVVDKNGSILFCGHSNGFYATKTSTRKK